MPSVVELEVSTKERFGFNITSLVQKWHNQQYNNGFAIRSIYGGDPFTIYGEDAGASEENAMLSVSYYYTQPNVTGNTSYLVQHSKTRMFMDQASYNGANSAMIKGLSTMTSQKWQITNLNNGYYQISYIKNNKVFVLTASSTLGQRITFQELNDGDAPNENQQWRIRHEGDGYTFCPRSSYSISNRNYTLCLGILTSNNVVAMCANDRSSNTIWRLFAAPLTLQYWNATYPDDPTDEVAYWKTNIRFYSENHSQSNTFVFDEAIATAFAQWNSALSVCVESAQSESTANMVCIGGDMEYFDYIGIQMSSNTPGKTFSTFEGNNYQYVASTAGGKTIRQMKHATIYILDDDRSTDAQKNIVVHEYGHALGYSGHSFNSNDVMYYQGHECYELTNNDLTHLKQIYDIFRPDEDEEDE